MIIPAMKLGPRGEALIKGFELLKLVAYLDEKGIPTIAYGHIKGVVMGMTCTMDEAEQWFLEDSAEDVDAVNRTVVGRTLNQNQFDALVSFTFNVGMGKEAHSTLIARVNAGDDADAANEFLRWDHAGDHISAGLDVRRHAERALYISIAL
jgi:lysozyme